MRVLLIDASQILYSSAFITALKFGDTATPIFGPETAVRFMGTVRSLLDRFAPSAVFVVWDAGRSLRRTTLYPEYKASRTPLAEATNKSKWETIATLSNICRDLRCRVVAVPGKEADDVLASLSVRFTDPWVISNDEDFLQLVEKNVSVYQPSKDRVINTLTFLPSFKFHPQQFKLYKAILGDSSDNIKGVLGVGEKTVTALLENNPAVVDIITLAVCLGRKDPMNFREKKLMESLTVVARNLKLIDMSEEKFSEVEESILAKSIEAETSMNTASVEEKMVQMGFKINDSYLFPMWLSPFTRLA